MANSENLARVFVRQELGLGPQNQDPKNVYLDSHQSVTDRCEPRYNIFRVLILGTTPQLLSHRTLARLSELAMGYTWQMAESWLNPGFGDQVHVYFAQPLATLSGCKKMCTSILHQSVTDRCESRYTFFESWFWGPSPSSCRTKPWPDSQNWPWGTHGKWLNPS